MQNATSKVVASLAHQVRKGMPLKTSPKQLQRSFAITHYWQETNEWSITAESLAAGIPIKLNLKVREGVMLMEIPAPPGSAGQTSLVAQCQLIGYRRDKYVQFWVTMADFETKKWEVALRVYLFPHARELDIVEDDPRDRSNLLKYFSGLLLHPEN